MLQSVKRALAIDPDDPWLHQCLVRFFKGGTRESSSLMPTFFNTRLLLCWYILSFYLCTHPPIVHFLILLPHLLCFPHPPYHCSHLSFIFFQSRRARSCRRLLGPCWSRRSPGCSETAMLRASTRPTSPSTRTPYHIDWLVGLSHTHTHNGIKTWDATIGN